MVNTKVGRRFRKSDRKEMKTKMGIFLLRKNPHFTTTLLKSCQATVIHAFSALTEVISESGVPDLFSNNTKVIINLMIASLSAPSQLFLGNESFQDCMHLSIQLLHTCAGNNNAWAEALHCMSVLSTCIFCGRSRFKFRRTPSTHCW